MFFRRPGTIQSTNRYRYRSADRELWITALDDECKAILTSNPCSTMQYKKYPNAVSKSGWDRAKSYCHLYGVKAKANDRRTSSPLT
ncbi:hypothetical protein TNCV_2410451 [Trichonephila clavipes]|nr:hypothetical protein TNCV_2410451 [Trichonephila clavipes]